MRTTTFTATIAAGSFAVLGLAGCAAQAAGGAATTAPSTPAPAAAASSAPATSAAPTSEPTATGATAAAGEFTDGDYSASGTYDSPGGPSAVAVSLTLKGDRVTGLKVVPKAQNPTAKQYEQKFADGVGGLVVGKRLSDVNVTTVSGSSLTSKGFDAAIAVIEGKAKA